MSFFKGMVLLLLISFITIGHFMIYDFLPVVLLCTCLSVAGSWYIMGSIRSTSWEKIRKQYADH